MSIIITAIAFVIGVIVGAAGLFLIAVMGEEMPTNEEQIRAMKMDGVNHYFPPYKPPTEI